MALYRYLPVPSDRMGTLWTLSCIKDAFIIEFGPSGTTHFAMEGMMQLNGDHNANIYTTHINETDISFGNEERLEKAIIEIDQDHHPQYIFVMASSISAIIGTDIKSICFKMQPQAKAKLIPITTGGYNGDYTVGVENTMLTLCKHVVKKEGVKKSKSYNIIGNTIDAYNFLSDVEEIKTLMKEVFQYHIHTTFTAYTSMDEIENALSGAFNLVLRTEGIKGAKYLKDNGDMPFYYGKPYGLEGTMAFIKGIEKQFQLQINETYIQNKMNQINKYLMHYKFVTRELDNKKVALIGDFDIVIGLAGLMEELGLEVDQLLIKHKKNKHTPEELLIRYKDRIHFNQSEKQISMYLEKTPLYLLLSDGSTLKLHNKSEKTLQIANPNFIKHNIYPYTPFVGFNGVLYMIQNLIELEKSIV
ncbi:nitrogenase molybdenum-cofactor synthesis protein NifE [Natranaerovirga hydrolytica]|uniref:Nitrogenase molybdenum-cofactor synthesis protein NifE n=1 Tax=Natranaerovirga hydrolytica TaxID=680378 RepID=A0A4R1MJX0_9FIRM|nr:nitrogenase component 1 [Natranaerovirga hydrolytica]TCK92817.1 nitrogenase molybdenum-cofactor synthesis protein NifE [Natranaerovirga hydrolytica]